VGFSLQAKRGVSQILGTMFAVLLILSIACTYSGVLLKYHMVQKALQERLNLEFERKLESIKIMPGGDGQLELVNEGSRLAKLQYVIIKNGSSLQVFPSELVGLSSNFSRQTLSPSLRDYICSNAKVFLVTERGNVFSLNDPSLQVFEEINNNISIIKINVSELNEEVSKLKTSLSGNTTIYVKAGDVVSYFPFFGLVIVGELPENEWEATSYTTSLGSGWYCTSVSFNKTEVLGVVEGTVTAYGYKKVFYSVGKDFGTVYKYSRYYSYVQNPPYPSGSALEAKAINRHTLYLGGTYLDKNLDEGKYKVVAHCGLYGGFYSDAFCSSALVGLYFAGACDEHIVSGQSSWEGDLTLEREVSEGTHRFDVKLDADVDNYDVSWTPNYAPRAWLYSVTIYRCGESEIGNYRFYGNDEGEQVSFTYNLKTGELCVQDQVQYLDSLVIKGFNAQLSYVIRQPAKIRLHAPAGTEVYLDGVFIGNVTSTYIDIACSPDQSHELHVNPPSS